MSGNLDYCNTSAGVCQSDLHTDGKPLSLNVEHLCYTACMTLQSAQRRDSNERGIITALRGIGATVEQMDKSAGFDLLIVFRGIVYIVEVKNPARKWKLEPAELAMQERVERAGSKYYIIETLEQMLAVMLA